jgi:hypothetical protein
MGLLKKAVVPALPAFVAKATSAEFLRLVKSEI